jgi:hypothetical protein
MPRVALLCCTFAATACGRVNFDHGADAADPTACDFPAPALSSLVDDFSDNNLAPNWFSGGTCIVDTNGELVAPVPANAPNTYCLAYTTVFYRVACDSFFVHVAEATTPTLGVQTVVYLLSEEDQTHNVLVLMDSGGFQLGISGDKSSTVYVPGDYDPVTDAWWRIGGVGGSLQLDTSPDGVTWAKRGSLPLPFPLDAYQITLGAGNYYPIPNPGRARFHCFNVPPPCS